MHHRQRRLEGVHQIAPEFFHRETHQIHPAAARHQQHAGRLRNTRRQIFVAFDIPHVRAGVKGVVLTDIQRNRIVFFAVERAERLDARYDGHLMLHAPAAEKDGNLGFHMQTIPFSRKSEIIRQIVFEQHGAHPLRRKPPDKRQPLLQRVGDNSRSSENRRTAALLSAAAPA